MKLSIIFAAISLISTSILAQGTLVARVEACSKQSFFAGENLERLGNVAEAMSRYQDAAFNGHTGAQNRLAQISLSGAAGIPRNDMAAYIWFAVMAEGNKMYAKQRDAIKVNLSGDQLTQATEFLSLLAQYKSNNTMLDESYGKGLKYEEGRGVKIDLVKAVSYYESAALDGEVDAQFRLGRILSEGKVNLEKNKLFAYIWSSVALKSRKDAAPYRISARSKISSEEIKDGDEFVAEFLAYSKSLKPCMSSMKLPASQNLQ